MKKKKSQKVLAIAGFSLLGICLLGCGLTYQLIVRQCVLWTCAPSRAFTIYDFTLPADLYPSNAIINPMILSSEAPGADSGVVAIYWEENGQVYKSILVIERFGTENKAVEYFDTVMSWRAEGSYHSHSDVNFRSQIANEYEIGCGISGLGGEYVCDVDARYQEFVISLNASITEQMSEKDFEAVAITLDRQFETFLSEQVSTRR